LDQAVREGERKREREKKEGNNKKETIDDKQIICRLRDKKIFKKLISAEIYPKVRKPCVFEGLRTIERRLAK
jgi:hypothetical protein